MQARDAQEACRCGTLHGMCNKSQFFCRPLPVQKNCVIMLETGFIASNDAILRLFDHSPDVNWRRRRRAWYELSAVSQNETGFINRFEEPDDFHIYPQLHPPWLPRKCPCDGSAKSPWRTCATGYMPALQQEPRFSYRANWLFAAPWLLHTMKGDR
jgi:hypothetical protein